jgi:DNA polymerase-1
VVTVIYDGNNLAYRSNSVMELSTKDGRRTSAIFGVLNSIPKDINLLKDDYNILASEIVMVWDYGRNKRRTDLYPEYKGNRHHDQTEEDKQWYEEFIAQTNVLHQFLPFLGVKSLKIKGNEADDLVYCYVKDTLETREDDQKLIVIISTDEDFLQLISERVCVFSPIKKVLYTSENFSELFGIPLEYFVGYKILNGDSSDHIKGIQGIGEKTAKKLVNEYGGLPGVLNSYRELKKSKVTARIFTNEGLSLLDRNNQLINLREFVDTTEISPEVNEQIELQPFIDNKRVTEFLKEYQLSSLLVKYKEWVQPYKSVNNRYYD